MRFHLDDLAVPILGAPMAGGPSTPGLAAAVTNAGGLGFLAGGYVAPQRLAETISEARSLTTGPIGVNLFVPQPCLAGDAELDGYRQLLVPFAEQYGVEPGHPHPDDDGWLEKIDVVADMAPGAVSFTFGCPEPAVLDRLRERGVLTMVTVSSAGEAAVAVQAGAGALVVQGPEAGGHRSIFDPGAEPPTAPLLELVEQTADLGVPVVAAGGLGDAAAVRRARDAGAAAAQVGTALLLCDEAGTSEVHRRALRDAAFADTVVTRAFSGRYARSLANAFTERYSATAPPGYPQLNQMTGPIRSAAVKAGDPQAVALWAGMAWQGIRSGRAADVVAALGP